MGGIFLGAHLDIVHVLFQQYFLPSLTESGRQKAHDALQKNWTPPPTLPDGPTSRGLRNDRYHTGAKIRLDWSGCGRSASSLHGASTERTRRFRIMPCETLFLCRRVRRI